MHKKVTCKRFLKPVAVVVLIIVTIIIYKYSNTSSKLIFNRSDIPMKYKIILYWSTFRTVGDNYFSTEDLIFRNCRVKNCFATWNKSVLPIEQYDAIIFNGHRYSISNDGHPAKRNPQQKYVLYSLESPFNMDFAGINERHYFNWTITYRRDSDIHKPYALMEKIETRYAAPSVEEIRNRTRKIAWFVSNCKSRRRVQYAKELNKYIQVDIYGRCGNLTCARKVSDKCYDMLERDYKFYLAFENSMCRDYVTEKLFNTLKFNVVPIMLGFFNNTNIAPPNSVINTEDFPSPKHLADYLWELDRNPEEYLKYFEWKKHYTVGNSVTYAACQLCELLNKPISYSSYDNIKDWYYGNSNTCLPEKT